MHTTFIRILDCASSLLHFSDHAWSLPVSGRAHRILDKPGATIVHGLHRFDELHLIEVYVKTVLAFHCLQRQVLAASGALR